MALAMMTVESSLADTVRAMADVLSAEAAAPNKLRSRYPLTCGDLRRITIACTGMQLLTKFPIEGRTSASGDAGRCKIHMLLHSLSAVGFVPLCGGSLLGEMCVTHERVDWGALLSDTWIFHAYCRRHKAVLTAREAEGGAISFLECVGSLGLAGVPAREWCHLIGGVTWLRQAPFGRFPIANGFVKTPHLPAGVNAGGNATLFAGCF